MFCLCRSPHVGRLKHSNARENARQCSYLGGDTVRSTWCICKPSPSGTKAFDIGLSGAPTPTHAHRAANRRTHCWRGPWQARNQFGTKVPLTRSDRARLAANRHGTSALPRQLRPDHIRGAKPAGIWRHQSNLCTINVPLHDKHVFDTHIGGRAVPAPPKTGHDRGDRCRDYHG